MSKSPFQQQYEWEKNEGPKVCSDGCCNACGERTQWGWCPNCTPMHYAELP